MVNEQYRYIWNLTPEMEFKNETNNNPDGNAFYYSSWVEEAKTNPGAEELIKKYSFRPEEELYDIKNDQWCKNNLAEKPELQTMKNELRKELVNWMKACGDKGQQTELEAFEHIVITSYSIHYTKLYEFYHLLIHY